MLKALQKLVPGPTARAVCSLAIKQRRLLWTNARLYCSQVFDLHNSELPNCSGCGAALQTSNTVSPGYTPPDKLQQWANSEIEPQALICQRCFSLKHYNTALNIALSRDDYLRHLSVLRDKKALVLLLVDVTDYPTSLFPQLHSLISPASRVLLVANKTDLLPQNTTKKFWADFTRYLLRDVAQESLKGCDVFGVRFVSAMKGTGLEELCDDITYTWGNRGDVYLLGCTNVGKSTLFNSLLGRLCGARPGMLAGDGTTTPMATISQWPGTTLGLLSFPLLSVGKRRRLDCQQQKRALESVNKSDYRGVLGEEMMDPLTTKEAKRVANTEPTDLQDVLAELGISRNKSCDEESPVNKHWLHDTPGAINDQQLINILTTQELKLCLPKKPLKPRTFILKPDQCLFIGGLARLDYTQGTESVYFTVFASSYLPIHTTNIDKADAVYHNMLHGNQLKIPVDNPKGRLPEFPALEPCHCTIVGSGWSRGSSDVVLSSAGWVMVTAGRDQLVQLRAHTPRGLGVSVREPLLPAAVTERGKRMNTGNRTQFRGKKLQ